MYKLIKPSGAAYYKLQLINQLNQLIMSNTLIRVIAQYHDENGKPAGGQEFTFRADSDHFLYAEKEVLTRAIQSMIDIEMDKWAGKYTYVDHELVFHEPIELQSNFEDVLDGIYSEQIA